MSIMFVFAEGSLGSLERSLTKLENRERYRIWPDGRPLEDVRYVIAWNPPRGALARLPGLEVIFSYGAGVNHLLEQPDLPDKPIVRFVDPSLTNRMTEYVALHTLFHHRRMLEYLDQQRRRVWASFGEPEAYEVRVGVMGLGVMGESSARKLEALGYDVAGWTRTPRAKGAIPCFAGQDGLDAFLARTEILVSTLPLTPETRGILDRPLIQKLARGKAGKAVLPGPVLINAGRGGLQVAAGILAALEAGELYAASLDVFEKEPLAADSPFWSHPRVVVTPHNAADSDMRSVVAYALRQIDAYEKGKPLENVVDRTRGY